MEQIIITKPNGNSFPLLSKRGTINVKSATQNIALLGEDVVNISVETTKKQNYEIGDTINIFGRTYKMNQLPKIQKTGPHSFSYDLVFEGIQYDLIRVTFDLTIDTTNNQLQDFQSNTLTGNLRRFAEVLLANVARVFPLKWELGNCPETANDKTLTFGESDNCLLVLQNLCKEFGTEFYIEQKNGKNIVHFGKVGQIFPHSFSYGKGKGIYKLERQNVSSSNIITRLKVYGSTKNITNKYRANRLCLPNKSKQQSYIENSEMIAKYGIWEATKHFENIAPTRTGTITGIVQGNVLKFVDSEMFNLNEKEADGQTTKYLLPNTTAKIHFNTGNLAGYQFDVQSYDHATRTFTIKKLTDERNDSFPNASSVAFQFAIGDKYKLIDIALPPEFEQQAEQDLLQTGQKYYEQNSQPKVQYALSVSEDFVKRKLAGNGALRNVFSVGDYIPIVDEDIDVNKSIRIQSFQRDVFKPYQYTLTISDLVSTSIVNKIISELIEVDKVIQINQLQDPIKAKRGWRDSQEIFNKVFDNEGYFDVERIKPLSIETGMINVGSRMQQFSLPNVILSVENNNTSVRNTVGQLMHLTIEDTPRTWQIPESVQTNIDADFHYIYVRAWRIGSMASIYISKEQIKVDAEAAYYYFLAGYLGSIENGFRRIKTTYGFTQVSPGEITTGRIAPPSGNHYIELGQDSINIVGNLHITDGNINQIKQSISPDLLSLENRLKAFSEQKLNELQVGGRNLVLNSSKKTIISEYRIGAWGLSKNLVVGKTYRITIWGEIPEDHQFYVGHSPSTNHLISAFKIDEGVYSVVFQYNRNTASNIDRDNEFVLYFIGSSNYSGYVDRIKISEGKLFIDWSPAPEDLQAQITAEQQSRQTAINEAKSATEAYARAQAELARTLAIANADGKITEAEQRQIANATQKLQEAKTFAEQKVNELQISSQNIFKGKLHLSSSDYPTASDRGTLGSVNVTAPQFNAWTTIRNLGVATNLLSEDILNRPVSMGIYIKAPVGMRLGLELIVDYDVSGSSHNSKNVKFIGTGKWEWIKCENITKTDNSRAVLLVLFSDYNTVIGTVEYKDFTVVLGNKAPEGYSSNPQNIEKDLQHAKAWADMFNDAEKANVEKISKIFQKQDDFVNGTYQTHNTIATGAIMVGNVLGGNAGINGSGNSTTDVRFWAGSNFANRANAPFRVLDNGEVHATNAHISGHIEATSGRIGGQWEGIRINTNGTVDIGSINSSDDNDSYFLGNRLGTDILSFKNQEGMGFPKTFRSETTAQGIEVTRRYNSTTLGVRYTHFGLQCVFSRFSDNRVFSDAYVGQAKTDVIEKYIGATKSFVFTSVSSFITVNLPSISQINEAYGNVADISFRLEIVCAHTMHDRIRIQGVVGGYLLDNNANRFSGGNGQLDMGKGDILLLRYYNHNYYVISHRN
ncbi:hypothetical protein ACILDU_03910 [Capnocytophaga canimorsus]|uniref:hypothetical protein n=1 Tax=Capnocytophaga canimorsus TaxID=28188 RepID=UPI0037D5633C